MDTEKKHQKSSITLVATEQEGSTFEGWGGACLAFGSDTTCKILFGHDSYIHNFSVSARFELIPGAIEVATSTSGYESPSSLPYSVLIDSQPGISIGPNATTTVSGVTPGSRRVELSDVPAFCTVQDPNPRNVTVHPGETTPTAFSVHCIEPGVIEVTTATRGEGLFPVAYTLLVGSERVAAIEPNDTLSFDDMLPGDHSIVLTGVPENCAVSGENGRTVTVVSGERVATTFEVECFPSGKGSILVSTSTTGQDLDPDGYSLWVEFENRPIGREAEEFFHSLEPGDYLVELRGISSNCEVDVSEFPNPRTLTVTAGEVTSTEFSVSCSPWGAIRVITETTGWDLDPDGYRVYLEETGKSSNIATNGEHILGLLTPGQFTIHLAEDRISENCVVQGDNPTGPWPLDWGQTMRVPFQVVCSGIVFQSNRDGFWELYAMNSDGTGMRRILPSIHTDENPVWSPDRTQVVFTSDRDGDKDIYVLTLADSSLVKVTDNTWEDDDPAWSPDGQSILFGSKLPGAEDDLFVVSLNANVWGAPRQITTTPSYDEDDVDWSPVDPLGGSAQWIAFSSDRDWDGDDELYKLDISQSPLGAAIQLTFNTVKDDDAVWSPDGTKIAFDRRTNGDNRDIFVMNADGSGVVQLTTHPGDEDDPSWSPDGTMIVFTSDRDGNDEVYVMNADGSGKTRITFHGAQDSEPSWR